MNATHLIFVVAICIASTTGQDYWREIQKRTGGIGNAIETIDESIKTTLAADNNQEAVMDIHKIIHPAFVRAKEFFVELEAKANSRTLNTIDLYIIYDNLNEIISNLQNDIRTLLKLVLPEHALQVKAHVVTGKYEIVNLVRSINNILHAIPQL